MEKILKIEKIKVEFQLFKMIKVESLALIILKSWDSTLIFSIFGTFSILCPLRGTYN